MPEKDEFDRYNVPAKSRYKIFQWGLGGMSATASILLLMLLRCVSLRETKVDELWNARLNDIKEAAKRETERQVQRVDNQLTPRIEDASEVVDSLHKEIKKFKN